MNISNLKQISHFICWCFHNFFRVPKCHFTWTRGSKHGTGKFGGMGEANISPFHPSKYSTANKVPHLYLREALPSSFTDIPRKRSYVRWICALESQRETSQCGNISTKKALTGESKERITPKSVPPPRPWKNLAFLLFYYSLHYLKPGS